MRSGWFWGTDMWIEYLKEYAKARPECLHEWRSSPLAYDHDFSSPVGEPEWKLECEPHRSQVIDLRTHKWSDIRKSYRGLINKAMKETIIEKTCLGYKFQTIHQAAFGAVRNQRTYDIQGEWLKNDLAQAFIAYKVIDGNEVYASGALWIVYQNCAYYDSGPSIYDNVQHAVIFRSLESLRSYGVALVDMGQIDGSEAGTRGVFKTGFGGEAKPFTIVRRVQ